MYSTVLWPVEPPMKYPSRRPARCSCTGKWTFLGFWSGISMDFLQKSPKISKIHLIHHRPSDQKRICRQHVITHHNTSTGKVPTCPAQSHTVKSKGPLPMASLRHIYGINKQNITMEIRATNDTNGHGDKAWKCSGDVWRRLGPLHHAKKGWENEGKGFQAMSLMSLELSITIQHAQYAQIQILELWDENETMQPSTLVEILSFFISQPCTGAKTNVCNRFKTVNAVTHCSSFHVSMSESMSKAQNDAKCLQHS